MCIGALELRPGIAPQALTATLSAPGGLRKSELDVWVADSSIQKDPPFKPLGAYWRVSYNLRDYTRVFTILRTACAERGTQDAY